MTTTAQLLESDPPAPPDERRDDREDEPRRAHRWVVHGLTVLAAVLLLFTAANTWVKRQMLDTDRWVATSDELLADEEISAALAQFVVDRLYASVDVQAGLADRLPEELAGLAGPIASGLRRPAVEAVDRLLSTGPAQEVWSRANRRAHETMMAILRDETRPGISTAEGTVTVDVSELVTRLAETLNLPGAVIDRIPEDAGTFTVLQSEELDTAQRAVTVIEWASILLFVLIVGLFAIAVWLARGWRRIAVRNIGLAVLLVGLVLLVVQRLARNYVLDNYVAVAGNRPVVGEAWWIATELLRTIAWAGVALGLGIAIAATLVGPARAAVGLRRRAAPALLANPVAVWGTTAAVILILLAFTPFNLFTTWLGLLGAVAVIVGAVVALRHTCRREATILDISEPSPAPS